MAETTRNKILNEAVRCVCTDREQEYGPVEDNFSRTMRKNRGDTTGTMLYPIKRRIAFFLSATSCSAAPRFVRGAV